MRHCLVKTVLDLDLMGVMASASYSLSLHAYCYRQSIFVFLCVGHTCESC